MNATTNRGGFSALVSALGAGLQWRLLLWWLLALALPTAIAALPVWSTLAAQFGHAPQAAEIAADRNF
ncbi:MAG: hypothetical protein L0H23_11145, partial [Luteimonas sp.]|nr:hypothetical protein [Luteimonas sp.]